MLDSTNEMVIKETFSFPSKCMIGSQESEEIFESMYYNENEVED